MWNEVGRCCRSRYLPGPPFSLLTRIVHLVFHGHYGVRQDCRWDGDDMSKSENFDHERMEILWHVVAFIARRGDSKPLAEFLRRHAGRHDSIDYERLADLIQGRLR